MTKITLRPSQGTAASEMEESAEEGFTPLTAEQAREWRAKNPQLSSTRVLLMQSATGVVTAVLVWAVTGQPMMAWSAAYGALVAVLPAALAARGMARWARMGVAGAALAGFLLWEMVKLALAVGMLMAAPKILGVPNWPALLVGLVLTIKVYWVVVLVFHRRTSSSR